MKTIRLCMLVLVLFFGVLWSQSIYSQDDANTKSMFVRVYDLGGEKIGKGDVGFVNDSVIQVIKNDKPQQFKVNNIGFIKTKRSGGHHVLIGAGIGLVSGAVIGASVTDSSGPDSFFPWTKTDGAMVGGLLGAAGGAAIGGISTVAKNSVIYTINGDVGKWKIFISDMKL
ncbi:hypothetical protein [Aestuariivivens insulae]|uniref:hypothetical protein n=1 Tax=Aestuariivivens insulae TaxID=1621988 RepID=UPI001F5ACBFF|nr:hypothetical protein [Aestuariivivens insulae]